MVSWTQVQGHPGGFDSNRWNAVEAGYETDGAKLYIGRGNLEGGIHVGKIHQAQNACYIPLFGKEHRLDNFEVLSIPPGMSVQWMPGANGQVPPNAVEGGRNDDGTPTYIGRFPFNGTITPGEIVPKENVCYISFMGKEEESGSYEVLVLSGGGPPMQPYNQGPVTQQPMAMQPMGGYAAPPGGVQFGAPVQGEDGMWMGHVAPNLVPQNCPPGLEYLTMIDQLLIKQKKEMLEAISSILGCGCETKNKYKVKNTLGQNVYKAKEDTDCCTRNCCGPARPFEMTIKDNEDREVIHLSRPLRCQTCCFPCCLQEMDVSSPPGSVIGSIAQEWSLCKPQFAVKDQDGNVVLKIMGPFCTTSFCGDVEFNVTLPDGETKVGKISKQWSGLLKESFTDTDNFGISFPMDLDVRCKATLIGAAFLIDYMYFEKAANQDSDGMGVLNAISS